MHCLDTSFIIDYLNGIPNAITLYERIKDDSLATTSISVYELLRVTSKPSAVEPLRELLRRLQILPLGNTEAQDAAAIAKELAPTPINELDILIAGIVRSQGITLISRDKDFKRVHGLKLESY